MHSFRVKKFSTINVSSDCQAVNKRQIKGNSYQMREKFKLFLKYTSLRLKSNMNDQTHQNQQSGYRQTSIQHNNSSLNSQKIKLFQSAQTTLSIDGSRKVVPYKWQNKKSFKYMVKNRDELVSKYNYIYNKKDNSNDQVQEYLEKFQNNKDYSQVSDKLFLSSVQTMRVQRSLQQFDPHKLNWKQRKPRSQRRRMQRKTNQLEYQFEQKQKQKGLSPQFKHTQQTSKKVRLKINERKIQTNLQSINKNLDKTSNKIYGKSHVQQSFSWCSKVLQAQLQQQFPFIYMLQQQQMKKTKKKQKFRNTKKVQRKQPKSKFNQVNFSQFA